MPLQRVEAADAYADHRRVTTYLSLGSNVEPFRHIPSAIQELRAYFGALRVSPVYGSAAVGFQGAHFLNLVVAFETQHPPMEVRDFLRLLETRHGRSRDGGGFSPRTLDIDLLLYGDLVSTDADCLAIPRAEILRYAFVLKPLADLAPDVRHPVNGVCYADLWAAFDAKDQRLWLVELDLC